LIDGFKVYHFMDTTDEAAIRNSCYLHDNRSIRADGGNLAAVLYRIRRRSTVCYSRIVQTIRQIAPWFSDFVIEPLVDDLKRVQLDWQDSESDVIYGPHILPDGAIRAIALIALLLQPWEYLPPLLIVDEPELGLHPSAVCIIAALLKQASLHCQVLVATQSPTLLNEFEPQDVIVVDREDGKSTFSRLNPERLQEWLTEYSLGELWQKNIVGGGPF
jgi:predicted ATPase